MTTITFMGTGDSMGVPRTYCDCKVCQEARSGGKNRRMRSSLWIETASGPLLLDCGPDWSAQMERLDRRHIEHVLITHAHHDHIGGLPEWADSCRWLGRRGHLFAPAEVLATIRERYPWLERHAVFQSVDQGLTFSEWSIVPWKVSHGKNGYAYAYRFSNERLSWAYCSDSINLSEEEKAPLNGLELLILGTNFYRENADVRSRSVYDMCEAFDLLLEVAPQKTLFTHMSHGIDLREAYELPAGVGLAAEGMTIGLKNPFNLYEAENDFHGREQRMKVKVGMIGVGGVAQNHLQNISRMETAELTAVCDLSDAALQAAVTAYGAKGYKDYREMLDKEALDAVYIAVPPFAHGTMEDDVIDKGIHLFVEKPVELNLDEARRKGERIREAGLISASGYCLRYLDALEQAKSFLAGKRVGMALAYRMGKTPETPWFRVMSKSGGQLVEMATHQVDLLRYLIGEITEVYSKMKLRHLDYMDNYDIYDVGTTTFDFACGAIGNIVTGTAFPHLGKQGVEIYGEDFRVSITGPKVSIVDKGVAVGEWASQNKMFEEEDFRFIEAVRTGDRSLVLADYDEGVKTLAVTLAANLSAESGRPVRIDEKSCLTVI